MTTNKVGALNTWLFGWGMVIGATLGAWFFRQSGWQGAAAVAAGGLTYAFIGLVMSAWQAATADPWDGPEPTDSDVIDAALGRETRRIIALSHRNVLLEYERVSGADADGTSIQAMRNWLIYHAMKSETGAESWAPAAFRHQLPHEEKWQTLDPKFMHHDPDLTLPAKPKQTS